MFQTNVVEKINTQILCGIIFPPKNPAIYKIAWKNMVEPDRPQLAIWYGACASHAEYKTTETHSEYVILSFHGNNGYANAPHWYSVRTLPVLFLNRILFTLISGGRNSVLCGLRGCTIRGSSPDRGKYLIRSKSPIQRLRPMEPPVKWVPLFLDWS